MKKENFGQTRAGVQASLYTMENENGMELKVTDYGATLVNIMVVDKNSRKRDVVLGYDDVSGYETGASFFGATVGRNANRIAGASFELGGKTFRLDANENGNNLHSGLNFYNKRLWEVKQSDAQSITFALFSPDGDQGYPGDVRIEVTYTLTENNEVKISYRAIPGEDTILNLTNHSYFNLNGEGENTILNHVVRLDADAFTETDDKLIPTGKMIDVTGTPMDFRQAKAIGQDIGADYEPLKLAGGYDHNWALGNHGNCDKAAEVYSPETGISMEVLTDLPGIQMYTGNGIENETGKGGKHYGKHAAVCFETQYFPDAVHHENFEAPVCKAGETYQTATVYKFRIHE